MFKSILKEKYKDSNDFVCHLNKYLYTSKWSDVTAELNESFCTNSPFYCPNQKNIESDFLPKLVYIDLKLNNHFLTLVTTTLQGTFFETNREDEFNTFISLTNFLEDYYACKGLSGGPELIITEVSADYTYQNFVEKLNTHFIDYCWHEWVGDFLYIKLEENQNKTFIDEKNILDLLQYLLDYSKLLL